ncbi:MAG: BamA/TamA family outer membrane protein [Bacteriovoracaceae bacterium]|nr:BamA/TamA family outer membrane protein [Bacteriovoracaceae bacterium]
MEHVFLRLFFILLFSVSLLGEVRAQSYVVDQVILDCENNDECKEFEDLFQTLRGEKVSNDILKEKVKFAVKDPQVSSMEYKLYFNEETQKAMLIVNVKLKKRVSRISHKSNKDVPFDLILPYLSVKEGGVLETSKLSQYKQVIKDKLHEKGYRGISVDAEVLGDDFFAGLRFVINVEDVVTVKDVLIEIDYEERLDEINRLFRKLKKKVWDKVDTKIIVDKLTEDLFKEGFYFSKVDLKVEDISKKEVNLSVKIDLDQRYNFSFEGNKYFSRGELISSIEKQLKNEVKFFSINSLTSFIEKNYDEVGIYGTKISILKRTGTTKSNVPFDNYYISIKEGRKIKLNEASYSGNVAITIAELQELYEKQGTTIAKRGYLDVEFLEKFSAQIKQEYLRNGFVFAEISKPVIEINQDDYTASVKYTIKEKQPVRVSKIDLKGVDFELKKSLLSLFINKEGENINLIDLQPDIERLQDGLRDLGYYFATITNANQGNVVNYNKSFTEADINIEIDLQKKTVFDGLLITGTQKTKKLVIERELELGKGDIVTPNILEDLKNRLTGLGLFSLVRISPYVVNKTSNEEVYKTNVLIQVREKDFGAFEFAPGYRTDLGIKASLGINYGNIGGYNHTISFKGQVNQRLDTSNINAIRRVSHEKMTEFLTRWNYNWPHVFSTNFEIDFSAQFQRRRYFDFDADILRSSAQISRVLWDYSSRDFHTRKFKKYQLTAALRYQLETISQYNASDEIDNDYFRIGGLTPSLSLDLRDDPIDPRNGAFFGLSWEFANPALQSIDDEDLVVDFSKIVSRNKFYYSLDHLTFAFAVSAGVEKNNSTDIKNDGSTTGYIPSIKVFRLDGVDTVRGYSNEEINVLDQNIDIGDVIITNKAYFANLKFEPRFRITDNFIMGPFFDAGRVYVDSFKPMNLRTSTGITLKLLTPVGSLDFDYGVKLKRQRKPNGDNEQFGRFHLSIGFF